MPLQGCIRLSHFFFLIFKPVFEHWTGREATLTIWMERQCQPYNGTTSYSHAYHSNLVVELKRCAIVFSGRVITVAVRCIVSEDSALVLRTLNVGEWALRGLPYMTSAKFGILLPPTPLCPNFMYCLSAKLRYFLTPPPPPSVRTSYMEAPKLRIF